MQVATKNKLVFFSLILLFIVPMVAAGFMYYTGRGIPQHTVNHGELILPPLPLAKLMGASALPHKWLLVYINPQPCNQSCLDTLYKIRQTRTALGKNRDRLERVLITYAKPTAAIKRQLDTTYLGTVHYLTTPTALATFLGDSPQNSVTLTQGRLYLVDPLGNMLQTYPLNIPFKALLSDLNRLLQISQIG